MRGLAAIFVVARHAGYSLRPIYFPNSFIAVDLFFVLSGFVIAAAYDKRLGSGQLTALRFCMLRFIRLWPLYVLATAVGLVVLYAKMVHGKSHLELASFQAFVPLSLLMLPSVTTSELSPANAVAWTLFYELLINILYAAGFRWLGTRQLLSIAAIAAGGIVAASLSHFSLDNGWSWQSGWVGCVRVGYSFPVGILLYRHRATLPRLSTSAGLVLLVLAGMLAFHIPAALHVPTLATTLYLDLAVLIVLPALVAVAVDSEPQPRWISAFKVLGVTSYAVYVLHPPLLVCIDWLADKLRIRYGHYTPWSGMIIVAIIFTGAYAADVIYDKPLRAWLTARFNNVLAARAKLRVTS